MEGWVSVKVNVNILKKMNNYLFDSLIHSLQSAAFTVLIEKFGQLNYALLCCRHQPTDSNRE